MTMMLLLARGVSPGSFAIPLSKREANDFPRGNAIGGERMTRTEMPSRRRRERGEAAPYFAKTRAPSSWRAVSREGARSFVMARRPQRWRSTLRHVAARAATARAHFSWRRVDGEAARWFVTEHATS